MILFQAKHILEGLDELSVDNLMCNPPRITNYAMAFAVKAVTKRHKIDFNEVNMPDMGMLYLAEQLNDMIMAAKCLRENLGQPKESEN